jgi:hypothetical protein
MALPPSRAQVERRLAKIEADEGGELKVTVLYEEEFDALPLAPYPDDHYLVVTGVPAHDPQAAARIWEPVGEPPFKFTAAVHEPAGDVPADVEVVRHSLNVQVLSRPGQEIDDFF